jgi:hypothetical protein
MAPTVVDDSFAPHRPSDHRREPFPQLDRSEALVEEDQIGRTGADELALEWDPSDLDASLI